MGRLMIKNIGAMVSGDISTPLVNADALIIEGSLIQCVGKEKNLDSKGVDQVIDVQGMTVKAERCIEGNKKASLTMTIESVIAGSQTTKQSQNYETRLPRPSSSQCRSALS